MTTSPITKTPEYQTRVLLEHKELGERLLRLDAFLETDTFKSLPRAEQDLLKIQSNAMRTYLHILWVRMGFFGASQ